MTRTFAPFTVTALFLLAATPALAQTAPDAGQILQQNREPRDGRWLPHVGTESNPESDRQEEVGEFFGLLDRCSEADDRERAHESQAELPRVLDDADHEDGRHQDHRECAAELPAVRQAGAEHPEVPGEEHRRDESHTEIGEEALPGGGFEVLPDVVADLIQGVLNGLGHGREV